MAILNNNQLGGASGQTSGGYTLDNSLRFRSSASAYLNRTPGSAGDRKTWTWSGWVKLGNITTGVLFSAETNSSGNYFVQFMKESGGFLSLIEYNGASSGWGVNTTALYRDYSAWYHITLVFDTTESTSTNRVKLYINGEQQILVARPSYSGFPALDGQYDINASAIHSIGRRKTATYYDGYLSEVNFVDGQALTPADFGETNATTGSWQPIEYAGTYGTNGFYLKGRGTDNSGNGNDWTENNFNTSDSTLTTYDIMSDVPTLTDEDTSNFATLNSLNLPATDASLSEGNLKFTSTLVAGYRGAISTIGADSGKLYWEWTAGSNYTGAGIANKNVDLNNFLGGDANSWQYNFGGSVYNNNTVAKTYTSYSTGITIGIAFDVDNGYLWFSRDGVWQGGATIGEIESGDTTNAAFNNIPADTYFAAVNDSGGGGGANGVINFGQRPFAYTPPSGFKKLNTFNLPDSTIVNGSEHFSVELDTGADIKTTAEAVYTDQLSWIKDRANTNNHQLIDSVRGLSDVLQSNTTSADTTYSAPSGSSVAWVWKGNGTGVSNTDGTIASTVSANTTAGFSIVSWTGTSGTVGHGLSIAPELIIEKKYGTTSDWFVQTTLIDGSNDYLKLNTTAAKTNGVTAVPTATVFTPNLGSSTVIAYAFHSVEGYSKFGTYTGNGSADGPFVYTGFRPAFVMVKRTSAINSWIILDNTREGYNVDNDRLYPNSSNAEDTPDLIDLLSNGFKVRNTNPSINTSSGTYIYMAFASNPFKNSLAR